MLFHISPLAHNVAAAYWKLSTRGLTANIWTKQPNKRPGAHLLIRERIGGVNFNNRWSRLGFFGDNDCLHLESLKWQQRLVTDAAPQLLPETMQLDILRLLLIWRHRARPVKSAEGAVGRKTSPSRRSQPASYGLLSVSPPVFRPFQPGVPCGEMRWLLSLHRGLSTLGNRPAGKARTIASRCRFCGTLSASKVRSKRPPLLDGRRRTRLVLLALGQGSCFSRYPSPMPVGDSPPTPHSDGYARQEKEGATWHLAPGNGSSSRCSLTMISQCGGGLEKQ